MIVIYVCFNYTCTNKTLTRVEVSFWAHVGLRENVNLNKRKSPGSDVSLSSPFRFSIILMGLKL
jgi:hypothetical protein